MAVELSQLKEVFFAPPSPKMIQYTVQVLGSFLYSNIGHFEIVIIKLRISKIIRQTQNPTAH